MDKDGQPPSTWPEKSGKKSIAVLWLILAIDAIVTVVEMWGAQQANSLALLSNGAVGLYDAGLIGLNIWGLRQELAKQHQKAARIARGSDILLIAGFSLLTLNALARLWDHSCGLTTQPVEGWTIIYVAILATLANWRCSKLCSLSFRNSESARQKLCYGSVVGLMTILNGALVAWFAILWIDPAITCAVNLGIIIQCLRRVV